MRTLSARRWALATATLCLLAAAPTLKAADDLTGKWAFGVIEIIENDLMILDVKDQDGKLIVDVVDSSLGNQKPTINSAAKEDGKLVLKMTLVGNDATFTQGGENDGALLGVLAINGQNVPARLSKTTLEKLPPQNNAAAQEKLRPLITAMQTRDPKARAEKLQAIIKENNDPTKNLPLYNFLFQGPEEAGLSEKTLRDLYQQWIDAAKPFGPTTVQSVQTSAIRALSGQKAFANMTFELAQEAEKSLPETASTETRAALVGALAASAKEVGKADVAAEAQAKLVKLDAELDEEYHKNVPPFKPKAPAPRRDKEGTRVVLFELFTGAQCPPCVAADVAFDALNTSYTPDEVITLQYHLHIPGPDPLTNPDSVARSKYYGDDVQGTPSTFFNGKSLAGGGGPMGRAEVKYNEYRELIEGMLEAKKSAEIDLKADLKDDVITINATAKADGGAKGDDADKPKDADHEHAGSLKLRFALIEESVRYVGGNRLRFHHHVVRALPGGPEGKELKDGEAKAELTVNLADLRQGLETYLSDFAKETRAFPNPLPEIKLQKLSVVAFVQDDESHRVLHAVLVPLGAHEEKAAEEAK